MLALQSASTGVGVSPVRGPPRVVALSRVPKEYPYIGKRPYLADRKPPFDHFKVVGARSGPSPLLRTHARIAIFVARHTRISKVVIAHCCHVMYVAHHLEQVP